MTVIKTIADWCADATSFSPTAIELAEHGFSDTIGCIIAGRKDRATLAATSAFEMRLGHGTCAVVTGARSDPATAALINGVAAHALDFDDNFHGATTHASAVLVPALLATAQASGRDGRQMIEAYIVGLEAQAWVSSGMNPSHYTAGWHATSTIGCIGTAAAVARLMGLDRDGIAQAMSVAVSMSAGIKGQFGTPVKPLHSGLAARNAIEAAQLSAAGMAGRLDVLESRQGFLALYGGEYPKGWSQERPPHTLAIERFGLTAKRHPCCGATHRAIDAVLDLKRENGFRAGDVASINVTVTEAHARNLAYSRPNDEMQARFSMQYALALALSQDSLRLSDFTSAAVRRDDLRTLLPLTELSTYDRTAERTTTGRLPHRVIVTLKDGRRLDEVRQAAKGDLSHPFTADERRVKFIDCACFSGLSVAEAEGLFARSSSPNTLDTRNLADFSL
ncbi:MmgE/PrpD family protein [Bradyrhizobium sp. C-145]|uniref:MmgE/PrpD family protein n=1 Tax=Bradyrhizobium sp. C-145 TaxID=574727 RepID=UPI00201B675D|nr:MmgE/PrpD family protein [Bradyrhizobium sp. C-145]UQR66670.1 MmgE/PrpD family protein [Bradyrhizobium sp. C-145]